MLCNWLLLLQQALLTSKMRYSYQFKMIFRFLLKILLIAVSRTDTTETTELRKPKWLVIVITSQRLDLRPSFFHLIYMTLI